MKKIIKLLVATSLIFATTTVSAFAQSYDATAKTIKDDVNYALKSRYYKDANINDFLLYTSLNTSQFGIDFAKQFEKLYFGLEANSNFLGSKVFTNTETPSSTIKTNTGSSSNSLYMLFGFNNMGINFYTSVSTNTNQTKEDSTITSKNNSTTVTLEANWGGSFNHDKFTYKPELGLHTNFDIISIEPKADYSKDTKFSMNLNNDFVFGNKNGLYSVLTANYTWGIPDTRYYNSSDVLKSKESSFDNKLFLSYLVNYKASEKVILGAEVDLSQDFNFGKHSDNLGNVTKSSFTYNLDPKLYFGMKYSAIPSKFVIDGGFHMSLPYLRSTTTDTKSTNTKKTTSNWYYGMSPKVCLGFEWTPFTNFVIDTGFSYSIGSNFDTLFNSISIGISYRK